MAVYVYKLPLSDTQTHSSFFLTNITRQLLKADDPRFVFEGGAITSVANIAEAQVSADGGFASDVSEETLLICGEGLNLEKLADLQSVLNTHLSVVCFTPLNTDGLVALQASLLRTGNSAEQSAINAVLEQLAVSLQIELVYLASRPCLSQPGLLLMDMDSTVIAVECIDEIAKLAGVGEQVSEVTELAMQGKLDFAQSLNSRVACLEGAQQEILKKVRDALPLMPGLTRLVTELKSHGWKVAIASGGFTFFADYLKERLELDAAVANTLEIIDGKLTGKVLGGIVDANVKAETLSRLAQQWNIPDEQTIAMGDGANDLVMMGRAGLGVAFHAKPIVREQADAAIRFAGLDALLWMLKS